VTDVPEGPSKHQNHPLRRTAAPAAGDRGLLLTRGRPDRAQAWARKGQVPAQVVPLERWTAVCPAPSDARQASGQAGREARGEAGREARGEAGGVELFAARPVPGALRPAVGLYVVGVRAVVTVHGSGRRAVPRWLVWQPGDALVLARPLTPGRFADLALAAGLAVGAGTDRIAQVLLEPSGTAFDVLADLLTALALPGRDLLDGSVAPAAAGGVDIVPSPRSVARLRAVAREDAKERAELEQR